MSMKFYAFISIDGKRDGEVGSAEKFEQCSI